MKVECMLCGRKYNAIPWTHLKYVHSITACNYHRMFPEAKLYSEERNQKISDSTTKYFAERPEIKQQISEAVTKYYASHVVSEEIRQLISKANLGRTISEDTKQKNREAAIERWKNPEYARSVSCHKKPNGSELQLQSILDKRFPGKWKYVGDGQFWVGGRNPDFINTNGKRQVIEMFGVFWHDPDYFPNRPTKDELIAHYKKYSFDCLVFWEFDVWCDENSITERIKDFTEN